MTTPKRFLFVCVENANRSQMAEAFARMIGGDAVEAYSAGSRPSGVVNPRAVSAMGELGYDLQRHASVSVAELPDVAFDAVVTMGCGDACPHVRAEHRADWAIPDPREMSPAAFRRVRDLIGRKVAALLEATGVASSVAGRPVPYTVVHAFTRSLFGGNPAGVCLLDAWLPDTLMQRLACENKLSETAFVVPGDDRYDLRWFTPAMEVDLCGHATLAAGVTLLRTAARDRERVEFDTRSGPLTVTRVDGDAYAIDLPACPPAPVAALAGLEAALGARPASVHRAGKNAIAAFDGADEVAALTPDFTRLAELDTLGVIATAAAPEGEELDFVSRYFAPRAGVDEDPVTGSAHCALLPFWTERLGRRELRARQISTRGGDLRGSWVGDRCTIIGSAVVYTEGHVIVPNGLDADRTETRAELFA